MPRVRMPDGQVVEVGADALFNDDDTPFGTPSTPPSGYFTQADLEKARQEEKDKLYGRIDTLQNTLKGFEEQIGTLSAAEEARRKAAEEEKARLEAEARAVEEQDLDVKTLLQQKTQEWDQRINSLNSEWESKLAEERAERERSEALRAKEREYSELREYIQSQVSANSDKIAPQLLQWVDGNTKDEVDRAVARAIETTDAIAADLMQQTSGQPPAPASPVAGGVPASPGTRPVGGPTSLDPAGQFSQQLTPEQIRDMPMQEFAKLRQTMGIGGQSNNRGLFG